MKSSATFQILTGKEQISLIRELMIQKLRTKEVSTGLALREIALAKNNVILPEEYFILFEGDDLMSKVARIYQAYEDHKAGKYLLDLDDLLLKTVDLFQQDGSIQDKYHTTPIGIYWWMNFKIPVLLKWNC